MALDGDASRRLAASSELGVKGATPSCSSAVSWCQDGILGIGEESSDGRSEVIQGRVYAGRAEGSRAHSTYVVAAAMTDIHWRIRHDRSHSHAALVAAKDPSLHYGPGGISWAGMEWQS